MAAAGDATLYRAVRIRFEHSGMLYSGKRDLARLIKFRTLRERSGGDVDFCRGSSGALQVVAPNGRLGDDYGGVTVYTERLRSSKWADDAEHPSVSEDEAFRLKCGASDSCERFLLYRTTAAAWSDGGAGPWRLVDPRPAANDPHHRLLVPHSRSDNAQMYQVAARMPHNAMSVQNLHSAESVALADALHLWEFCGVVLRAAPELPEGEDDGSMSSLDVIALALELVWLYERCAEVAIRAADIADKLTQSCPDTPAQFVLALCEYERALVVHALLWLGSAPGFDGVMTEVAREIAAECDAVTA